MVWVSDDLAHWRVFDTAVEGTDSGVIFHLSATHDVFAGQINGDLHISEDGVNWKQIDLTVPEHHVSPSDQTWWGDRLAVVGTVSDQQGLTLADLVDETAMWTGPYSRLDRTVIGPQSPFWLNGRPHDADQIAAGPAGIAVLGSQYEPNTSTNVWISHDAEQWTHKQLDERLPAAEPSVAVGARDIVVLLAEDAHQNNDGRCIGYTSIATLTPETPRQQP